MTSARRAPLAIVLVGFLLLAGCTSGSSEDAPPSTSAPIGTVSAEGGTEQTGKIVGIVTDEELVPLANVTVAIVEKKLQVVTNAGGAFEFLEVPFGKYGVTAQRLGYNTVSKGVNLSEEKPAAEVKITLTALVIVEAYHTTNTWAGKMSCGLVLVPWCGLMDELNQDYGTPNPTNERWLFNWTIPGGVAPANTVFELVWTPSFPSTAKEFVLLGLSGFGTQASGPSVLRMEIDGELWADDLKKDKNYKFQIGVYPELADPVIDQRYNLHRSDFFGEPSPEGWTYLPS